METDAGLDTLVRQKDHLNVLRYLRVHQIRKPELAVSQGKMLLGPSLSWKFKDELARLAVLEQVCLASLDLGRDDDAKMCLDRLKESSSGMGAAVPSIENTARFRVLLARSLEAAEDYAGAELAYDELLKENPANLVALKRKYCILRAQVGKEAGAMEALNRYLQKNYGDTAAWYEMAKFRLELGDYGGAAFALEETLLGVPADSRMHCELAECYATMGGKDNTALARKHMAQSLELDPTNRRALFGLVSAANGYLECCSSSGSSSSSAKNNMDTTDEHEVAVAKELVRYGAEKLLVEYKGTAMFSAVKALMSEYTEEL